MLFRAAADATDEGAKVNYLLGRAADSNRVNSAGHSMNSFDKMNNSFLMMLATQIRFRLAYAVTLHCRRFLVYRWSA